MNERVAIASLVRELFAFGFFLAVCNFLQAWYLFAPIHHSENQASEAYHYLKSLQNLEAA